jgi:endonuclease-3
MKKQDKAERIALQLAQLYPAPTAPLQHDDPFTLLVAVLLSAQTTDARVNMVTPQLFARARSAEALSRLSVEEIHALIRTCGLAPTKAKNLAALARLLVERHGGRVPADLAALEALPGVGHKTASVVIAQAFGIAAFPVDTHIHRLAARWGLSDGSNVVRTERDLKRLYRPEQWHALHLQMIYFGREHCPALRHDGSGCPICVWAAPATRLQRAAPHGPAKRRRAPGKAPVAEPR